MCSFKWSALHSDKENAGLLFPLDYPAKREDRTSAAKHHAAEHQAVIVSCFDRPVRVPSALDRARDFAMVLRSKVSNENCFRGKCEGTGQSAGNADFISSVERYVRRPIA